MFEAWGRTDPDLSKASLGFLKYLSLEKLCVETWVSGRTVVAFDPDRKSVSDQQQFHPANVVSTGDLDESPPAKESPPRRRLVRSGGCDRDRGRGTHRQDPRTPFGPNLREFGPHGVRVQRPHFSAAVRLHRIDAPRQSPARRAGWYADPPPGPRPLRTAASGPGRRIRRNS